MAPTESWSWVGQLPPAQPPCGALLLTSWQGCSRSGSCYFEMERSLQPFLPARPLWLLREEGLCLHGSAAERVPCSEGAERRAFSHRDPRVSLQGGRGCHGAQLSYSLLFSLKTPL